MVQFEQLDLKEICFVVKYRSQARSWVAQKRQNHILGLQMSGKGAHDFGYQKLTLEENCIFFLNQRDDYAVEMLEKGEAFSVHFITREPIETDSFCIRLKYTGEVVALLEKIQKAHVAGRRHQAISYFYQLCALYDELRQQKYMPTDSRMAAAREYMDQHFAEPDCLETASAGSGVSRRRFNELFKTQFLVTPNRYLVMKKIAYAMQLLQSEYLTVSEIAEICGFSDIYYFSNVFRKETGEAPTEYRRQQREHKDECEWNT